MIGESTYGSSIKRILFEEQDNTDVDVSDYHSRTIINLMGNTKPDKSNS